MSNPWDNDPIVSPASGPVTIGSPDPYKAQDQHFQQNADARAAEASRRAAEDQARQEAAARRQELEWTAAHNPDGTPKPKAGGVEKQLPPAAASGIQANLESLRAVDAAIADLSKRPGSIGPGTGALGTTFTQFNDPAGQDVRGRVGKIGATTIHDLSGAAVSASEAPRFQPFVPTITDRPEVALGKLHQFREALDSQIKESLNYYGPANGYLPYSTPQAQAFLESSGKGAPPSDGQLTPEQEQKLLSYVHGIGRGNLTPQQFDGIVFQLTGNHASNAEKWVERFNATGVPNTHLQRSASGDSKQALEKQYGDAGLSDLVIHGATLGLSDEAAGVGNALANAIVAPLSDRVDFDPVGAYQQGTDVERARLDAARQRAGWAGTAAELGGSLASGNVAGAASAIAPTLGTRMVAGARAGAAGGSIAGFGYGEGPSSILSGVGGAVGGAAVGAALPVAGQVIGNRVQGLRRMVGADPGLPRQIVNDAIVADGHTPATAGGMMDDAATRGSPMMLADTGENSRALLASVGRQPGPSRAVTRTAVIDRQNAQAERIGSAVHRDLGPTANIRETGDQLIEQARNAARPHYERFENAPGASVVKLDDMATRPSFQKALGKAVKTAQEEGSDPMALGFRFNEAGEPVLDRDALSWRTLDAVKKGLDDVVEEFRNPITGRLDLKTGEARATNATRQSLIARMDRINPAYAEARAAYAGPAAMREALEKGAKSLTKTPDDILAMMNGMGDSEREAFRMGVRKSIVDMLGTVRDGGDKVARLLGTPKSRAVLTRVFGGRGNFDRFVATLRDEEAMGFTHRAVTGNSATAERMAQDAQTNDTGLAESAMDAALRGGKDGAWSAVVSALQGLRQVQRFGAGQAGERTRESVAALLTETDPAVLRDLIAASRRAFAQQRVRDAARQRRAVSTGRNVGDLAGILAGQTTKQPR